MKPCISQVCTLTSTFAEDVSTYADAGWRAIEVWLTKLEEHLARTPVSEVRKLLADKGIEIAAASSQGGLLSSEGAKRQAHFDHFRKRLDICESLGIPRLVLSGDFHAPVDQRLLELARESLREAARWADGARVTLALEFLAGARFCNNLRTALAFVAACGEANVGVDLDVFHFQVGPSKSEDLALLTQANLAFVQVSDLSAVLREQATDADRILPGDGELNLSQLLSQLQQIPYDGWVSLELMNPVFWRCKPAQVAQLALQAMERLVGPFRINGPDAAVLS
jgi:sugar phosphate isomerase/epimerase